MNGRSGGRLASLIAAALVALAIPRASPVLAVTKCVAFSPSVIIREGPGRNYSIAGTLPEGSEVTIIASENGWHQFAIGAGVYAWQGSGAFEDCEGSTDPGDQTSEPSNSAIAGNAISESPISTPTTASEQIAVAQLEVDDGADTVEGYSRLAFGNWKDADHDCQYTRHEVLVSESEIAVTFKGNSDCFVDAGEWYDPYTDSVITSASQLDVDHMVPLANAYRSGGWGWSNEKKHAYMNFMADQDHLIAVSKSANRSKSDRGPEDWRPPNEGYWCEYAQNWTSIKNTWGLTATSSEQSALSEMLDTCPLPVVEVEAVQTDNDTIPEEPAQVVAPTATASPADPLSEQEQQTSAEAERTGAICNDGSTSSSTGSGTCSGHGGVSEWLQDTPEPQPESTQPVQEQVQPEQQQQEEPERERTGATCDDGWISQSTGSGTCAGHGGVAEWLYGGEEEETESEPDPEPGDEAEQVEDTPEQEPEPEASDEAEQVEDTTEEEPEPTPEPQAVEPEPTAEPTPEPTAEPEPEPEEEDSEPVRTGAVCRDGSESSATGSGACSHHGGVDHWIMSDE